MSTANSFRTRTPLTVEGRSVQIYSLPALQAGGFPTVARLPYSMKILLENLLRHEDGRFVKAADVEALAKWDVKSGA
jgi:aconitate hydratase A / 2-methylisocitrate dehydratase